MKRIEHISAYYKLTVHLFKISLKRILLLCAALFVLTWILLLTYASGAYSLFAYETLVHVSNIHYIFIGFIAFSAILSTFQIYFDVHRNHGGYTLLTLPLPRRNLFFAYCTVGILSVLMLWAAEALALITAYSPVTGKCAEAAAAHAKLRDWILPFSVSRTNGLYLAIMRNGLFRLLIPLSLPEAFSSVLIVLTAGSLPAYGLLGGPKRLGPVLMLFAIAEMIWAMICRYNIVIDYNNTVRLIISTLIMAVFFVYAVLISVRNLNRSANLL